MSTRKVTIDPAGHGRRASASSPIIRFGMILATGQEEGLAAILSRPDAEGKAFVDAMKR
ncbi:hypothetical protein OVY48_00905 [Sphingobium sp. SA2]|uniref:hypothetical protein n=1 Tax=Sphingobium sp. SA2 TaxID=1524832 RepID=UPI0028C1FA95|nr:hypothetical protein [Sphingobium sp. SA2]MDT7532014.1 hypothetical protein [Sphingobium sp. SA2]